MKNQENLTWAKNLTESDKEKIKKLTELGIDTKTVIGLAKISAGFNLVAEGIRESETK